MSKKNNTHQETLLELVLGYREHTSKMYEWLDNLKQKNTELKQENENLALLVSRQARKPYKTVTNCNPLKKAGIVKSKPTNFDKITESVESLAEIMANSLDCTSCPCQNQGCLVDNCEEKIKEWLQKEADNE